MATNALFRAPTKAKHEWVQTQMRFAMFCGRRSCARAGSDVWRRIPCAGSAPTPEELIVWAAREALRRMAEG